MYTLLMVLFIILCLFLTLFILIQQGKGDWGLGSMGGSQMLFGGSGGQEFFEKITWILGGLFIFGALGLSILKSKEVRQSVLADVQVSKEQRTEQKPLQPAATQQLPINSDDDRDDVEAQAANEAQPLQPAATTNEGPQTPSQA